MPFDNATEAAATQGARAAFARPVDAWTTHEDLTDDQKARFGDYIKAKDEARRAMVAERAAQDRTRAAMLAAGGDPMAALVMLLANDQAQPGRREMGS